MQEQISRTDKGLLVRAPAKINLTLLIAGKRDDGFHEIETIMAKVDLYDEILFERNDKDGIELICRGKYQVPCDQSNLVYRACSRLLENTSITGGIKVTVSKNIPVGAGLGGGSSDAASAMIGLNEFLDLGYSSEELSGFASVLGSDVAFFLGGPLAFCTGKGEKISEINELFDFSALLLLPDVNVSTKMIYENYVHDAEKYDRLHRQINGYIQKKKIDLAAKMCANMLEGICLELNKELADLKDRLVALDIGSFCLTGSGSAMYYIGRTTEETSRIQCVLRDNISCESVVVNNNRW